MSSKTNTFKAIYHKLLARVTNKVIRKQLKSNVFMIDEILIDSNCDLCCRLSNGKYHPITTETYSEDGNQTFMVKIRVHNGYFLQYLTTIKLDPYLLMCLRDYLNSYVADQQPITLAPIEHSVVQ